MASIVTPLTVGSGGPPRSRDHKAYARVLMAFIATGLVYMLLPGTFLGVLNLLQVTARKDVSLVSAAWLQAHGHAQVFGWVATFILGIGLYSIPVVRADVSPSVRSAWTCWVLWTSGVGLHWAVTVYAWHWRMLLPLSAGLELAAFAIFFRAVSAHQGGSHARVPLDLWVKIVIVATIGFLGSLLFNAGIAVMLAWRGSSLAIPHGLNQRFLILVTWGFLAPFVWGFSTKWLPVLLGLRTTRRGLLASGVGVNAAGVVVALAGGLTVATWCFVAAAVMVGSALRLFELPAQQAKTRGVHAAFPLFVRLAYVWLVVAACLGVAAARWDVSGGIWGASRHAFTVGFIATMVFSIGQRVLPAFAGARLLWSPRLMGLALLLLTVGCVLRVGSEIVAYQGAASWAWRILPVSAILELAAVATFALNMFATFASPPVSAPPGAVWPGAKGLP